MVLDAARAVKFPFPSRKPISEWNEASGGDFFHFPFDGGRDFIFQHGFFNWNFSFGGESQQWNAGVEDQYSLLHKCIIISCCWIVL